MYQIYVLLFTSGHYYIGRSKDYRKRYIKHKIGLLNQNHPNRFMQSVYNLHGVPKCILLMHCIDCYSIEQIFIDYNYGKDKCVNISTNSMGGAGKNSIPPILTRDETSRCNIKTKDIANITKLLKILPIEKVAKYYRVCDAVLRRICKKYGISYMKAYKGPKSNSNNLKLKEGNIVQFVLDAYKLNDFELADKYNVGKNTILYWRKVYQIPASSKRLHSGEKISKSKMGHQVSEKTRAKLSQSLKGKKHNPERIEKAKLSRIGRACSEETKAKISLKNKGKTRSEEHKLRISETAKERKLSQECVDEYSKYPRQVATEHLKSQFISGLSQRDYCKQHSINESTFSCWKKSPYIQFINP